MNVASDFHRRHSVTDFSFPYFDVIPDHPPRVPSGAVVGQFRRSWGKIQFTVHVHTDGLNIPAYADQEAVAALSGERIPQHPLAVVATINDLVEERQVNDMEVDWARKLFDAFRKTEQAVENLLRRHDTHPAVLRLLGMTDDPRRSLWAARNPNTPGDVLRFLAGSDDGHLVSDVAEHPNLPSDVVDRFLDDSYLWPVAVRHPNLPAKHFEFLASHSEPRIRRQVARNPSLPDELRERLATDHDSDVRCSVAASTQIPTVLVRLARDASPSVRAEVAGNRAITSEAMDALAADDEPEVLERLLRNNDVSAEILTSLSGHLDAGVRARVAGHPATSPNVLTSLASDQVSAVRAACGRNPGTPGSTLDLLGSDEDPEVQRSVVGNPGTPAGTLLRLADNPALRSYLLYHETLPAEVICKIAPLVEERGLLLLSDLVNTPRDVLESIASHPDEDVNWLARERLGI